VYPEGMAGSGEFPLKRELETFEAHRGELLGRAPGKYALVHHDELAGVFDTEPDAIDEGYRTFGNVPFLVKRIEAVDVPERLPYPTAA
jgi:hypothetical protein